MAFAVKWLLTNKYARWLGLILLAIAAAFGYGELKESQGRKNAELDRAKENLRAAKDAKDNRHEIETDDDQRIIDILTGRVRR